MNKKIVFVVPTLRIGGMERAVLNFALPMSDLGHDVSIFVLSDKSNVEFNVPSNIRLIFGCTQNYSPKKFPKSLLRLRRYCVQNKVEYVFSFSGYHSSFVVLSLLFTKTKVFAFHRANPYLLYGKWIGFLNKLVFPLAEGLVVQTELARQVFSKRYKHNKIFVVPNPIKNMEPKLTYNKEKVIISLARLVKSKRIDKLVQIFEQVADLYPDWELWIIGDGPERKNIENQIENSKVKKQIKILGQRKNIEDLLGIASIFAFTSDSEGFPNSLLEAMCAGLACISFDCIAGPSEIIMDGENGFLVENNNDKMYIDKLIALMSDENLRKKFSTEAIKLNHQYNSKKISSELLDKINAL